MFTTRRWRAAPSLSQLAELASQVGFSLSPADLLDAFRHEWVMRWLHTRAVEHRAPGPGDAGYPQPIDVPR